MEDDRRRNMFRRCVEMNTNIANISDTQALACTPLVRMVRYGLVLCSTAVGTSFCATPGLSSVCNALMLVPWLLENTEDTGTYYNESQNTGVQFLLFGHGGSASTIFVIQLADQPASSLFSSTLGTDTHRFMLDNYSAKRTLSALGCSRQMRRNQTTGKINL
jgi:hypothetical protein